MNMLLQNLEDSRLTDNTGRVVSFKNTVIIMTSNVGAKLITDSKKLGFSNGNDENANIDYENTKKDIMQELKKEFRPEFINRIDEIIVFHKLAEKDLEKIVELMLNRILKRLENQDIFVSIDDSVKKYIRSIQKIVEDNVTDAILDRKIKTK